MSGRSHFPFLSSGMVLLAFLGLLLWPEAAAQAVREGLSTCGSLLVPALFPFFVLSSLVVELGLAARLGRKLEGLMAPLFRVNGACAPAVVLGLLGGCPVGARTVAGLYEKGLCSRPEALRLLSFCSGAGPAFILGAVGEGLLGSRRAGLVLFLLHLLAALLVGLLFRFYGAGEGQFSTSRPISVEAVPLSGAFAAAVRGSLSAILSICAFVISFGVLLALLEASGLLAVPEALLAALGLDPALARALLSGFLELSSGTCALRAVGSLRARFIAAGLLLGWTGLSVHGQTAALLADAGLSAATFHLGKALHALLTAGLAALAAPRLFGTLPAFAPAENKLFPSPFLFFQSVSGLLLLFLALIWVFWRKKPVHSGSGMI